MLTVIRTSTRRSIANLVQPVRHHALLQPTRASSALAVAQSSTRAAPSFNGDISSNDFHESISSLPRKRKGRITVRRVERLTHRGQYTLACRYILSRANQSGLSANPLKRKHVLKAIEVFLRHGAIDEARTLQHTLFPRMSINLRDGNYYGLLLMCLNELTPSTRSDWNIRAHGRILRLAHPILRVTTANELARVLDRLLCMRDAGAQLCIALAGAYARVHGEDNVSRRLGIQIARAASSALVAEPEARFRQSLKSLPGVEALMRNDKTPMPWAARALRALQRPSRLEQNLADAQHARHLRALYEERAKGKGPLEPVTFTMNELVRDDGQDTDNSDLSDVQLDLIAEGARMSLLASAVSQRAEGEKPSKSEHRMFRKIGARLAAFTRADFERMSEAELNDLIARQEQYMKMMPLLHGSPQTDTSTSEVQAPSVASTTSPDAPARAPEGGTDTCTVAGPVQSAGSIADLSDASSESDFLGLPDNEANSIDTSNDTSFETQLRSVAEILDIDTGVGDLDMNVLGQGLVKESLATRKAFESGIVDQGALDRMVALVEHYKELQALAEAEAQRNQDNPSVKLAFDEVVHALHSASASPSTERGASGISLRPGVSTLAATTTFMAEVARLGGLKPAHITAALATMSARGIEPDARVFTVFITASVRAGDVARAHALYDAMLRSAESDPRLTPTSVTFASLFKAVELPQPKSTSHPSPRNLFLPSQPTEGIRTPRVLFREMIDLHDRITCGVRTREMGKPGPDFPAIAIITRDSMHIILRAFLRIGDLPGALGTLHAFKELHMRPSHRTYNIVFRELAVHIQRDIARQSSIAGPASSRWSARFIGKGLVGLTRHQLMKRLYENTFPEGPRGPREAPNPPVVRSIQQAPRGARWEISPLERLLEGAVYAGMEPKVGLEALTREVVRDEVERARKDMVPPLHEPQHVARAGRRVSRAWRTAKLRERKRMRRAEGEDVEDMPRQVGEWEF